MTTSTNQESEIAASRRRPALRVSLLVAGISTVAAPLVVEKNVFPEEPIKNIMLLSGLAAAQYAASYLIVRMRSLSAARVGFVVTTSLLMTLASSVFAFIVTMFSSWSPPSQTVLYARCFLAFGVVTNVVLLVLSIRYVVAARQECTLVGTIGGIAAALFLPMMLWCNW